VGGRKSHGEEGGRKREQGRGREGKVGKYMDVGRGRLLGERKERHGGRKEKGVGRDK
jgi:hypothetical protein